MHLYNQTNTITPHSFAIFLFQNAIYVYSLPCNTYISLRERIKYEINYIKHLFLISVRSNLSIILDEIRITFMTYIVESVNIPLDIVHHHRTNYITSQIISMKWYTRNSWSHCSFPQELKQNQYTIDLLLLKVTVS